MFSKTIVVVRKSSAKSGSWFETYNLSALWLNIFGFPSPMVYVRHFVLHFVNFSHNHPFIIPFSTWRNWSSQRLNNFLEVLYLESSRVRIVLIQKSIIFLLSHTKLIYFYKHCQIYILTIPHLTRPDNKHQCGMQVTIEHIFRSMLVLFWHASTDASACPGPWDVSRVFCLHRPYVQLPYYSVSKILYNPES